MASTIENDYNPFGVTVYTHITHPDEIQPLFALPAFPVCDVIPKREFAKLSLQEKAAYADGIIRGCYKKQWVEELIRDMYEKYSLTEDDEVNKITLGGIAYIYLKNYDKRLLDIMERWRIQHSTDDTTF